MGRRGVHYALFLGLPRFRCLDHLFSHISPCIARKWARHCTIPRSVSQKTRL